MALVAPADAERLEHAVDFRLDAGGAEANVASHLAALGHRAAWAGRVGDDALGRRIVAELAARGVDVRFVETDASAPTGVYFKDPGAEVLYRRAGSAAAATTPAFAATLPVAGTRVLHLSGITPALSGSCDAFVERLLSDAGAAGVLVSFDVNHRAALWPSGAVAAARLLELASRADLVFVGLDEAERLWGARDADAVRALLPEPARLVVKDGARRASEYSADGVVHVPAARFEVVEAIGAGDAFAGGYLAALLDGADAGARLAAGHARAATVLGETGDFPRSPRRSRGDAVRRSSGDEGAYRDPLAGSRSGAGTPARPTGDGAGTPPRPKEGVDGSAFDELFAGRPVMALFRGLGAARSVELAHRAWALGIELVELPIQSEEDVAALAAVADAARPLGRVVGAGTVVAPWQVPLAAEAGAAFVVSPGFDPAVVLAAAAAGLPALPGVATASEVQAAQRLGLRWLKAFPAASLGPGWFRAMRGPFPDVRFVATGGIDAGNAAEYLGAGARVVAIGSALEDEAQLPRLAALLPDARRPRHPN